MSYENREAQAAKWLLSDNTIVDALPTTANLELNFDKVTDNNPLPVRDITVGRITDPVVSDPGANATVISFLKGILTKLSNIVLGAGNAIIGKVGIDQTTPGTTNGVVVNSISAGDNNIGNVDISSLPIGHLGQQVSVGSLSTTPATDIADGTYVGDIKFGESLPAGTNSIGKVVIDGVVSTSQAAVAGTLYVYNITMTNADTEYSQLLPDDTKAISVSVIGATTTDTYNFRVSFETGKVATPTSPYLQYAAIGQYYKENVLLTSKTVYVACSEAGKTMQIEVWT